MGDNFLEEQAGNTKKRRARAEVERDLPKLIHRPDLIQDEFTIDLSNGAKLLAGDQVLCFPGKNGSPVDVVRENHSLGKVDVGGGNILQRNIEEAGIGKLEITSVCELSGTAKAKLV